MLKIIKSFDKSTFSRNNNSQLTFRKNNGNNKANKIGIGNNNIKYAKKLEK